MFKIDDKRVMALGEFKIPTEWWSRGYEYAFAADHLKDDEIIIDAGCGIEHPFKWYAMSKSRMVYAVDRDDRILEMSGEPGISYLNIDLIDLPDHIDKVDKIFCISVFEHMPAENQGRILEGFSKVLNKGGKVIMTCDFPTLMPETLKELAKPYFTVPNKKYKEDDKDVYSALYSLKVYGMILTKR